MLNPNDNKKPSFECQLSQISKITQNFLNFGDYDFTDFILNETSKLKKIIERQRNQQDNVLWFPDLNFEICSGKDMNSYFEDERNEFSSRTEENEGKISQYPISI